MTEWNQSPGGPTPTLDDVLETGGEYGSDARIIGLDE